MTIYYSTFESLTTELAKLWKKKINSNESLMSYDFFKKIIHIINTESQVHILNILDHIQTVAIKIILI